MELPLPDVDGELLLGEVVLELPVEPLVPDAPEELLPEVPLLPELLEPEPDLLK